MTQKQLIILLLFITGLGGQVRAATPEKTKTITLAIDPWYPWVIPKQGATSGGGVNFIKELYRRLGFDVDISLYPFKRVLSHLETGNVDSSWLMTKNASRQQYALFSEAFLSEPFYIYSAARTGAAFEWHHWQDLKNHSLGLSSGFYYGQAFHYAAKTYDFKTHEVKTDFQLIKMLLGGRLDLIILNQTVAQAMLRDFPEFHGRLHQASKAVIDTRYYILLSKKSPHKALLPKINDTIKAMKEDGSIQRLLKGAQPLSNTAPGHE
ncbi:substrate-binding periplasmic protein [Thalassomonas haliotis]|uniref:Transporter substrate-binding domain-containing protein n=1 Tax=Thalassomonas haliotis TaxID=485448 RepID=A0ABY7VKF1_9GAMM|nr:transporter substrate-binding domain-containing protein [Thalassomonas haliotis]WDE14225.1 transporter substrate-binding domain-containing protein [Thalassomonas haliotis]